MPQEWLTPVLSYVNMVHLSPLSTMSRSSTAGEGIHYLLNYLLNLLVLALLEVSQRSPDTHLSNNSESLWWETNQQNLYQVSHLRPRRGECFLLSSLCGLSCSRGGRSRLPASAYTPHGSEALSGAFPVLWINIHIDHRPQDHRLFLCISNALRQRQAGPNEYINNKCDDGFQ